ncbi:MAG: hypothetical protein AAFV07_15920, partial [Bacteroidota bacterium]
MNLTHCIWLLAGSMLLSSACRTEQDAGSVSVGTSGPDSTVGVPAVLMYQPLIDAGDDDLLYPGEKHLRNIRQLTFGGDNAEAYFSFDDKQLVMQITHPEKGIECDQIYRGTIPTTADEAFTLHRVSTGTGRTTCSYFMPKSEQIIFASTHNADVACPPVPDRSKIRKYVWPIYDSFEL